MYIFAQDRVAFIIGNSEYTPQLGKLDNPIRDAKDMEKVLNDLGFYCTTCLNANFEEMKNGLDKFSANVENKEVVFFFAGHGIQIASEEYLLPTDVPFNRDRIPYRSLKLNEVLSSIRKAKIKILMIDACRNTLDRGVLNDIDSAKMDLEGDMLVLYACLSGQTASDGSSQNGIFTSALLKYLKDPNMKITDFNIHVTNEVLKNTGNTQRPCLRGSISQVYYFNPNFMEAHKAREQIREKIKKFISLPEIPKIKEKISEKLYQELKLKKDVWEQEYAQIQQEIAKYDINYTKKSIGENLENELVQITDRLNLQKERFERIEYQREEKKFVFIRKQTYKCNGNSKTVSEYRHKVTGLEFVLIPQTIFFMGNESGYKNEKPRHQITLEAYLVSKTEVTQGVWEKIMSQNPSCFKKGANYPVENISWNDCQEFCHKTGLQLPTEAQWEYCCQANIQGEYYFGNETKIIGEYAWYEENSNKQTHLVAQKLPNVFGLYDVLGNVSEWVYDSYGPYPKTQNNDVFAYRVVRGGSYYDQALFLRSTRRDKSKPEIQDESIGFRVVAKPESLDEKE